MATITTRAAKGSALTFTEVDDNFTGLNADGVANTASIATLQSDKFDKAGGTITGNTIVSGNITTEAKVSTGSTNNSQSGSNVTITTPTSEIIRFTNPSLTSIDGIQSGSAGQKITLLNAITTTITIENLGSTASASNQIYTGTGGSLALQANSSISLVYDSTASKWTVVGSPATSVSSVPTATILSYAGSSAPSGFLICDGTAISRTSYSALYAVIGTTHGQGDGATTFNIPDLRWSFLRGTGPNITANGSGTAAGNQATFTAHGFNRTGVKVRLSSGTLSGLSTSVDYWVIVSDANTLAFATSKANALSNTRIGISGANSAVIIQYEDPDAATRASNTNGANSGANVGSAQTDALQNITGSFQWRDALGALGVWDAPTGAFAATLNLDRMARMSTSGSGPANMSIDASRVARTSTETRPLNISVNYIIKV